MNGLKQSQAECRFDKLSTMSDVTEILCRIENGDPVATDELLPIVYAELRSLAASKMAREQTGHSLQPTALVHEAYLRLVDRENGDVWNSRGHFFAAAAEAMRRILIEHARRRAAVRRGGKAERRRLSEQDLAAEADDERLIALDEALQILKVQQPKLARLVELRYFTGLTIEETAHVLGISTRSANRYWTYAKAWLGDKTH